MKNLNTIKSRIIILMLIFFPSILAGQNSTYNYEPNLPLLLPPSPQAQQYMRYGEIPVGLSTGTPEIDIPIYTLEAHGLKIPITISYHASGIKVRDISGPVGLGWVLNAGGIITQTVNGVPDDYGTPIFKSYQDAINQFDKDRKMYAGHPNVNIIWSKLEKDGFDASSGPGKKTVSDRFFYNFNGNTGVFRKDVATGEYKTIPYSPIKIKMNKNANGYYTGIELTDTEGRIWHFKKHGTVFDSSYLFNCSSYEYYLEKITFPNSIDEIIFTYKKGQRYQIDDKTQSIYFGQTPSYRFIKTTCPDNDPRMCYYNIEMNIDHDEKISFMRKKIYSIDPVLLSRITWRDVTIDFTYTSDRVDKMKERLTSINIKNNNTLVQQASLSHKKDFGDNATNYRMLLNGLTIGSDTYSFNYNQTKLPSYPDYSSNCHEDFWGYYNGTSSSRWIPFKWSWIGNATHNNYSKAVYIPEVREANDKYSQAGILTEIIYPTKGKTVFTYEQNKGKSVFYNIKPNQPEIDSFGGVRVKEVTNYDNNIMVDKKTYEYEGMPTMTLTPWHFYSEKSYYYTPVEYPVYNIGQIDGTSFSRYVPFITRAMYASSSGLYPFTNPHGQSHIYTKVIETIGTSTSNIGKTEYNFKGRFCGTNTTCTKYNDYGLEPVLMSGKKEYDSTGTLKRETIHSYNKVDKGYFSSGIGVQIKEYISYPILPEDIPFYQDINGFHTYYYDSFEFAQHTAYRELNLLSKTVINEYTNKNSITNVTEYEYDPSHRILSPIKTIYNNSDGKSYVEKINHPFHYPTLDIYSSMISKNMLSPVVEHIRYKKEDQINPLYQTSHQYKKDGNFILLSGIQKSSSNMGKEINYHKYDSYGNPVHLTMGNIYENVVYIWGYSGKYPIAEIKNATYDQVKSIISETDLNISPKDLNPHYRIGQSLSLCVQG